MMYPQYEKPTKKPIKSLKERFQQLKQSIRNVFVGQKESINEAFAEKFASVEAVDEMIDAILSEHKELLKEKHQHQHELAVIKDKEKDVSEVLRLLAKVKVLKTRQARKGE